MSLDVFYITPLGKVKMEEELRKLKKVDRKEVRERIGTAREFGDLSENAEYSAAKEMQGFIESRILDLESKLSRSEVVDPVKLPESTKHIVKFGATVVIKDEASSEKFKYSLVSEYEANLSKGLMYFGSPTAKAMIGKSVYDICEVTLPKGKKTYEILEILYEPIYLQ